MTAEPRPAGDADRWTVRLARALRRAGVPCTVHESLTARAALRHLDRSDPVEAYFGLRSVFVSDPAHFPAFDRAFWRLWREEPGEDVGGAGSREETGPEPRDPGESAGASDPASDPASGAARRRNASAGAAGEPAGDGPPARGRTPGEPVRARYSRSESLSERSFGDLDRDELRRMERVVDRLSLKLATRRSRRLRAGARRGRVDLRRSLRDAVRHDGEVLRPARRRRRIERPRIVLLCDVSGSMERYSRFLLRFLLAAGRDRDVESFVFSTGLTRLTRRLRASPPDRVLDDLSRWVPDWSGGTRIGECLQRFLADHGRTLLGQRTVVVIMSDGLDRGEIDELEHAMRGIQRRARKVIWLNPLLATRDYEPEARGMKAALPHVDRFAPGHDLEALRELARMVRL